MRRIHYTYKLSFPEKGFYYFGKHSTSNPNDRYRGSGVETTRLIKEGYSYIVDIIALHESCMDALNHEAILVSNKYKTDPMCLNRIRGGAGIKNDLGTPNKRTPRKDKSKVLIAAKLGADARRGMKDSIEVRARRSASLSKATMGIPKTYLRKEYVIDNESFIGIEAVKSVYKISSPTIYNRVKSEKFPSWTMKNG